MTRTKRSGLVWIVSGLFLLVYSIMGLLQLSMPGVEELVAWMNNANGWYLYIAAFLSILLEGLYVIGNFLPGTTMVLVLVVISEAGGATSFIATIMAVFLGWIASGVINIIFAHTLVRKTPVDGTLMAKDRLLTTWFPAFRANYEVAQVVSGIAPWKVFLSTLRVKALAIAVATVYAIILPYFINIREVSNQEGFLAVFSVALICLSVGGWQTRKGITPPQTIAHS